MGIILEIELRGERDVQQFRNSEMDMSGSRQPCLFPQSRKIWRNRISPRHDGFELIVPLLIGQHHGSQVEIPAFVKLPGLSVSYRPALFACQISMSVLGKRLRQSELKTLPDIPAVRRARSVQPVWSGMAHQTGRTAR